MQYSKAPLTIPQQIAQLQSRGLIISDIPQAAHYLANISYYRLAGYWWPLQSDKVNHIFKPNSHFQTVIDLYNFDRELRVLIFDVIERIEIGLRTRLMYHLSHEFDPWWFQNTSLFINSREMVKTLSAINSELERSKDTFIKHHFDTYTTDYRFPPAWKTLEVASFGNLSKLYGNLRSTVRAKDIIAAELKVVNHTYLPSWLQSITQNAIYAPIMVGYGIKIFQVALSFYLPLPHLGLG